MIDPKIDNYFPGMVPLFFPDGDKVSERDRSIVGRGLFHFPGAGRETEISRVGDGGEDRLPAQLAAFVVVVCVEFLSIGRRRCEDDGSIGEKLEKRFTDTAFD